MVQNKYTCYTAQKDLVRATDLIKTVMQKAENKIYKSSLKQILQSLKPVTDNTIYQFYKENENNQKGLFK